MTSAPPPARDPGLQGERTALSWTRTALVIVVNALLALRSGWVSGQLLLTAAGIVLVAAAIGAVLYGSRRGRALAGRTHEVPPAAPTTAIAIVAATTLLACVTGIASVLVAH
ncbi:DUF202 domain-containing protein [Leifsonia sp. NPDC058292]|uniref:DUF202 domain-containing protein n=1 Tax=Leifsonia sp. NPDC058292 TaxID=3346428 RepID=UPI0036DCF0DD